MSFGKELNQSNVQWYSAVGDPDLQVKGGVVGSSRP